MVTTTTPGGREPLLLRTRLQEMAGRLMALEKRVTAEAKKKRDAADQTIQSISLIVNRIERALTHEIQNRVDSVRQMEERGLELIKRLSKRLDRKVEESVRGIGENLTAVLNALEGFEQQAQAVSAIMGSQDGALGSEMEEPEHDPQQRCLENEERETHERDEMPLSLEESAERLCSEMISLQRKTDGIKRDSKMLSSELTGSVLTAIDEEHRIIVLKLREMKKYLNTQLADGLFGFQTHLDAIRLDLESYRKETDELSSEYKLSLIPQEMESFQHAFQAEAQAREETDDDVVVALNRYNAALQKGCFTIIDDA